jgi:hypothetical protein
MSCGCKTKKTELDKENKELIKNEKTKNNFNGVKYFVKLIGFFIALLTIPFIVLFIIWFMFDLIVLNNQVDMQKAAKALISKIKFANEDNELHDNYDDDDYDDDELDETQYIAVDVDDITPIKND